MVCNSKYNLEEEMFEMALKGSRRYWIDQPALIILFSHKVIKSVKKGGHHG